MFVRYSCGCIGLPLGGDHFPWVVKPCDADGYDDPIQVHPRADLRTKEHTPLPDVEAAALLDTVSELVVDGYRYRQIRSLLGVQS